LKPARVDQEQAVVYRELEIVENSLWRWLTRGDRVIYTIEALENGGTGNVCAGLNQVHAYVARPDAQTDIARKTYPACSAQEAIFSDFYGLNTEESVTEIALDAGTGASSAAVD